MGHIKFSFIDNDFVAQAKTDLDFTEKQRRVIARFFEQIQEELITGQTAHLEIEGLKNNPFTFTIAEPS